MLCRATSRRRLPSSALRSSGFVCSLQSLSRTHAHNTLASQKLVLTGREWGALVVRLNESSRRKQGFLLRAQHQQIAAELAGLTFVPHISEKSRELAAQNKSLPQRVEALMRRKKARLDKIRHDRVEEELREATFKPNLTATRHARAAKQVTDKRRIGHLMQYVSGAN